MSRARTSLCLLAVATGCASPVIGPECTSLATSLRAEDLLGFYEHSVELEDGSRGDPAPVFFASDEDYLFVLTTEPGPAPVRAIFAIEARLHVREAGTDERCPELAAEPPIPAERNRIRVDWSQELAATAVEELLGEEVEPVPRFVEEASEVRRRPALDRDPSGRLIRLELPVRYLTRGGSAHEIVHTLRRDD